ncbi:NAD(P)H-quinone oxidoreductase [Gilvimarinus sp. SDUM040013]|nr:NAD(P)H-quinone oxidoreductase [Gilvimarinus sp. SDUM040013]MDO3388267.1 NAD(P)H-quinone oxidoreductase [Gilvimarinus sp. SDUM040013]
MQAIECSGHRAEDLKLVETTKPIVAANQLLIKVMAAGVNRPDILQRQGFYPPPANADSRLGLEVAGTVAAVGKGVSQWQLGDRVCALVNGGGYAQYCVAEAGQVLPIPAGLTAVQAASLPETYFTVWHNLFQRANLMAGERVLIHGGSGGIGTTAVQLAAYMGAEVVTTAGSARKCNFLETLGATRAINYRSEDFVSVVRGMGGANVILDIIGGDYIARNFKAAASEARIVNIAFLQGSKVNIDLLPVMLKRLEFTGSTLRSQSDAIKAKIAQELKQAIWPLLETGAVRPVVTQEFLMQDASQAHALMESGEHMGKLVLINEV